MNDDPLTIIARYVVPTRDPDFAAAMRIADALVRGDDPPAADWFEFEGRRARVVHLIANQIQMPTDSDRALVYGALANLRAMVCDDAV